MKKTDADTIVWPNYDQDFVDWLFYIYETTEQMPDKRTVNLMASAFARGKETGFTKGYAQASEDC